MIVGREREKQMLQEALNSKEAELIAVYGRRRVGKTYLVREFFKDKLKSFELSGQKDANLGQQLQSFAKEYGRVFLAGVEPKTPKTWMEAFDLLTNTYFKESNKTKKLLFIDELPWIARQKSGFLEALDYYWNQHWSRNPNCVLVLCGSAASWMLDRVVNAKGGLHNRLTRTIRLDPFTLKEANDYLQWRGLKLSMDQLIEIYMVMGGVPFYLKQLDKGKSVSQNISTLCFGKDGFLVNEFKILFSSLFENSSQHEKVVKILSKRKEGFDRKELLTLLKQKSGGSFNRTMDELEASSFIHRYVPFGKKTKDHFYKLSDEYSIFYLNWMEGRASRFDFVAKNYWSQVVSKPEKNAWSGFAFEAICLKHIHQICRALEIEAEVKKVGSWRYIPKKKSKERGCQIDLIIERTDGTLNLCEIKFSQSAYLIDKQYALELDNKKTKLVEQLKYKGQVFMTLICNNGMKKNLWSEDVVDVVLDSKCLMTKL